MLSRKLSSYLVSIACGILTTTAMAAPNADLQASRLSGPAPLAVSFDATGTTSTNNSLDTFRETGYHFVFDDPSSGTWEHSGKNKNVQIGGPLAAHVFDNPGTYDVELRVREPDGTTDSTTLTIEVLDPNQVYSGNNTVVISRNSDVSGAPSGAQVISNANSWPSWESNKRYLLRAGQDFTSLGNIDISQRQDIQIDKFGDGAKPITSQVLIESSAPVNANWAARISIRNLNSTQIYIVNSSDHILFYQNTSANTIDIGTALTWWATAWPERDRYQSTVSQMTWPTNTFVVENTVTNPSRDVISGSASVGYGGRGSAWMGNDFADSGFSHTIRIWMAHKTFIGHNRLISGNQALSYTAHLKLHSLGHVEYSDLVLDGEWTKKSSYIVIADNFLGDGDETRDWSLNTSPQNSDVETEEALENIIMENNSFDRQYAKNTAMSGRNMIERGSVTRNNSTPIIGTAHIAATGYDGPYYWNQQPIEAIQIDNAQMSPPMPPVIRAVTTTTN